MEELGCRWSNGPEALKAPASCCDYRSISWPISPTRPSLQYCLQSGKDSSYSHPHYRRILTPPTFLHRILEGSIGLPTHTPKVTGLLSIATGALRSRHPSHLGMKPHFGLSAVIWWPLIVEIFGSCLLQRFFAKILLMSHFLRQKLSIQTWAQQMAFSLIQLQQNFSFTRLVEQD